MRSVLGRGQGALAVALAVTAWGCSPSTPRNPTAPAGNASTVSILGQFGAQSFAPNPALFGGELVLWRNNDGVTHRIVANDLSFDLGNIAPGATSPMVRIATDGVNYHCTIHPTTMFGVIGGDDGEVPQCTGIYCE